MNPADRHFEFARSLFREANDAFFLFDPATQAIVDLNPAALRLTGLEKDAACTLRLEDLFSAAGAGGLERLTQALATDRLLPLPGGVLPPQAVEGRLARQPQREPDPHRARDRRAGRGARHQRPQAGRGGPQAGRDPLQEPGRVDRRDGLGGRRRRRRCSRSARHSRPSPAGRPAIGSAGASTS